MSPKIPTLLGVFLWTCFTTTSFAQDPTPQWTPERVAAAIETQASASSFARLEQFGRNSLQLPAPERLRRLDHVAWIFVNESDFKRFKSWNDVLKREALRANNRRFQKIAELNETRSRYDQGEIGVQARVQAIASGDSDWYSRALAMSVDAYMLMREEKVGDALQRLAEADSLVPEHDPMTSSARSRIWESEGLALGKLQDLKASAAAFGRTQFDYGTPGYPRPDFDGIYNMAKLAAQLGDHALADHLAATHHRLVERSGEEGLRVWDRNLCTAVAQPSAPRQVLNCLKDLDLSEKGDAHFLASQLLPSRAIAYAELGRVAEASRDLRTLQKLRASKAFADAQFEKLPLVEAAVLHAKGQDKDAYESLLSYGRFLQVRAAQRFSAGIGQVTEEMQKQLGARRDQLVTARRNVALEHDVIGEQNLLELAGIAVVAAVMGLLVWQWRVAGQLRRAREAADAANRAKSEFLANMSHEIRTPLNGVVAVADMLARSDLDPKAREMAEIIRASGDTLQRLLSDILDVARIESGKIALEIAPFQVGDMVRAVAGLSQLKCDEKGVRLLVEIAPDADQTVLGDLVRVRQVVTNLLNNAVKFTEKGEVRLTVERTPQGLARFTVADTGVGFSMTDKAKVLGRFEQADSSITRRFGGTGLGLSICCDLATLMGGLLDCESMPGEGARFWLQLPLEPTAEGPAAEESLQIGETNEDRPLHILLADDHPTNRRVVELMLDGGLAALTSVEDGAQAVEAFRGGQFDLVLMDMQMPVMDGLAAIREIRRIEAASRLRRTPVIMLTANALPEHISDAAAAGADAHLAKPFTANALFGAIDAALAPVEQAAVA
jgi:signal transduction histidine kinase/ActR/RegA family two-component response regulator